LAGKAFTMALEGFTEFFRASAGTGGAFVGRTAGGPPVKC
jgi:hypothetical protein